MRAWTEACALLLAGLLLAGCTIERRYVGAPLPEAPETRIATGATTMAEILDTFGAPRRIVRGVGGDVFIYAFTRRNSDTLSLEEPVFTGFQFFSYSIIEEKSDRLVVLFDEQGIVRSFGLSRSTPDLDD